MCADDTLCISKNGPATSRLLKAIVEEGSKYGMRIKTGTFEYLVFGGLRRIHVTYGTDIQRQTDD